MCDIRWMCTGGCGIWCVCGMCGVFGCVHVRCVRMCVVCICVCRVCVYVCRV